MPRRSSIRRYVRASHDSFISRLSGTTLRADNDDDKTNNSPPRTPPKSPTIILPKLTQLPTEILILIAHHLRAPFSTPEKHVRFEGSERYTFVEAASHLHSLSLTSSLFRPIAQEQLLHTIVLDGLGGLPAIVSLVRFLLDNPDSARHVKRLRLGLPPSVRCHFKSDTDAKNLARLGKYHGSPPADIWLRAAEVISSTPFDAKTTQDWLNELEKSYARPLCGVLLVLCERLEWLSISRSVVPGITDVGDQRIHLIWLMFAVKFAHRSVEFAVLPRLKDLRYFNGWTECMKSPWYPLPDESKERVAD